MKLSKMTVQNFRSIKNSTILFKEIMAIVGENNAGKTALLRALNSVFNWEFEAPFFYDNTHQYKPKATTKIELVFEDIPKKDVYANKIIDNNLMILFTYSYGSKRKHTISYRTDNGYEQVEADFISELKKDIDYVYIPASRSNNDLIWFGNSIFKRLLISYSKRYNEKRDNISKKVKQVADMLKNIIFSKLEKEITNSSVLDRNDRYVLKYGSSIDYSIFLDKVDLALFDNIEFPIIEYGSGIKSLTVIALYRVLAQIEGLNVILGIEEPETNLHPQAQKKLISAIKNNRQNTEVQAIMATHSTVIVDELDHENIILATRKSDKNRGFYTAYAQLSDDFWNKYNLNEYKHRIFFKYRNSEFFFSKYVIIVESSTDAAVISYLIDNEIGDNKFFVSILNLDGCNNLKYPYFLLKSLRIPFSIVLDRDVLTAYKNDGLDDSRDEKTKLPLYKNELKTNNPAVNDIWDSNEKNEELKEAIKNSCSYSRLYELCSKEQVYIMRYCLEMDLVANKSTRQKFCDILNVPFDDDSYKELLVRKRDSIKSVNNIMNVISSVCPSDYPHSYKKIRKSIIDDIKKFLY